MNKLGMPALAQLLVEARADVTHARQKASAPSVALGIGHGVPPSVDDQCADLLDELIVEPASLGGLARCKQHGRHE